MARCTMRRSPLPSSAMNAAAPRRGEPSRNRCLTPRRSPIPSSPTVAAKSTGRGARTSGAAASTRATASIPARPRQLSVIPGAWMRLPANRGSTRVPAGKTVSRCAATTTGGPSAPSGIHEPSTLPTSSVRGSHRSSAANRRSTCSPRTASWNGGAGMRTSSSCSASVCSSVWCTCRRRGCRGACRVRSRRGPRGFGFQKKSWEGRILPPPGAAVNRRAAPGTPAGADSSPVPWHGSRRTLPCIPGGCADISRSMGRPSPPRPPAGEPVRAKPIRRAFVEGRGSGDGHPPARIPVTARAFGTRPPLPRHPLIPTQALSCVSPS